MPSEASTSRVALVADESDRLEDRRPLFGAVFLRDALLGDHDPEALGTVAFGPFGRLEDLLGAEEAVGVDAGVEVDRLRTEAAILGAVARLRVDDRAGVDRAVAEVIAHGRAGLRERLDRLGRSAQSPSVRSRRSPASTRSSASSTVSFPVS